MSSEASERLASLSCGMTGELLAQCSAGQGRACAREAGSGAGAGAARHRGRYSALPGTVRWLHIAPCLWHQGAGHPWPRPCCILGTPATSPLQFGSHWLSQQRPWEKPAFLRKLGNFLSSPPARPRGRCRACAFVCGESFLEILLGKDVT